MTAALSREEIDQVARQRFGEPNARMSTRRDLRFGRRGSTSVKLDTGEWYDHECGEGGILRPPRELPTPQDLWDQAHPLMRGSPGWTYWVERRCCCVFPGLDIREHGALWYEANRKEVSGLVAGVRNLRGEIVAISRTFLDKQGRKFDRKFLGKVSGCHVVIHDPGAHALPGHVLVGEGLESTASAAAERPECVAWSSLSAGGMSGLALPAVGVTHLTIAPDMDAAGTGQRVAAVLAARARQCGLTVAIIAPPAGRGDFNDVHRASRQLEEPSRFSDDYEATTRRIAERARRGSA